MAGRMALRSAAQRAAQTGMMMVGTWVAVLVLPLVVHLDEMKAVSMVPSMGS